MIVSTERVLRGKKRARLLSLCANQKNAAAFPFPVSFLFKENPVTGFKGTLS